MAYRLFPDGEKHPISLFEWDSHFFVSERTVKNWHQVTSLSSREDDVLLCGYPKSGLHWLWEIVTMLKTGSTRLTSRRMETQGFLMQSSLADLDALPSPRILTTHRRFYDLPSDCILKHGKMVCILREPKDICVSYYHMVKSVKLLKYEGTFQGFVPLFLAGHVPYGTWPGWVRSYQKGLKEHPELSVHVVHYEQLKAKPVEEIGRLAQYLGCPERGVGAVAEQTHFSTMKAFKAAAHNPMARHYKNDAEAIFRKGQTEEWRQYFTPQQAADFDTQVQAYLGQPSVKANL